MTPEERNLITGLFNRLQAADSTQQKDAEADQLIRQSTAAQPAAPYLLVQTLLVQEHALSNALARIKGLEQELAQAKSNPPQTQSTGGGSFLSGLFGHHSTPTPQTPPVGENANIPPQRLPQSGQPVQYAQNAPPPFPSTTGMAPGAGGGFLRSALTTAAGVAGGALLFQGIEGLLGHNAGPFGPALGSGSFFGGGGGGGFLNTGGRPEIIENNEVINNYYDESGNREESPHHHQAAADPTSREDADIYNAALADDPTSRSDSSQDADIYNAALADDPGNAMDNTYDNANPDAGGGGDYFAGDSGSDLGGDSGSSNDDSSYA